jgi:hypothetical protein
VLTDAQGIPLAATGTAAKAGPQREKPERLQGDTGYDSEPVRQWLRWLGITPTGVYRKVEQVPVNLRHE